MNYSSLESNIEPVFRWGTFIREDNTTITKSDLNGFYQAIGEVANYVNEIKKGTEDFKGFDIRENNLPFRKIKIYPLINLFRNSNKEINIHYDDLKDKIDLTVYYMMQLKNVKGKYAEINSVFSKALNGNIEVPDHNKEAYSKFLGFVYSDKWERMRRNLIDLGEIKNA